jgi:hypothetical protein
MSTMQKKSGYVRSGKRYLQSGLTVLLGAGATLGGSFLISRIREKQNVETRLDRLEQMLEQVGEAKEASTPAPKKAAPRKRK